MVKEVTKNVVQDYKEIRQLSHRIDCTVTEADFNTNRPNPYRIAYVAGDIHRYLAYAGGKHYDFKY